MPLNPFGSKATVGLDLGHRAIRVAQIERQSNGWRITKYASVPTPAGSIKDGVVVEVEEVAQAIRQALREAHVSASSVHIAVSGGTVVVRVVRIPYMAEATLRKSIKYEAGRYVPSSAEDSYIEFEIVGRADDGQMDVLLAAAPKEIVQARMAACEAAGLEVDSVDVEPFAAYRSLVETDPELDLHGQTFSLIDVGAANTRMSVIQNGIFTMTRTIPNGAAMLTEALKGYFKLSEEDAESGKAQLDIAELIEDAKPRENPPLRVIQPHVDDLVREIRRSLNYFQSQLTEGNQGKSVETLLLTGGGAKLHGLAAYIGHKLGLPTKAVGLFENQRFSFLGTGDLGDGMDLAVVAGLAMRSHIKPEKAKAA
jgi:type IV pilus assembly protein PilM